ncbi:hypothetical protein K1719_044321 [Acacia pycnantha]|nr:hypothetical protein K1719_044321 [Acacia pycnantha]
MEPPLSSDEQLWNLVASLDHECRGRTKYYVISDEDYDDDRPLDEFRIDWSTKASEDDDFIHKEWGHGTSLDSYSCYQCIMVLELNEETCMANMEGCGWRLIRKQEIRQAERCNLNDFNQVTQPQLATPHEVSLPWRATNNN